MKNIYLLTHFIYEYIYCSLLNISLLNTGLLYKKYDTYGKVSTEMFLVNVSIKKIMIFERKILRKIFGPTKEENGLWRIKTNEELDELIKRKNIISFIKSQRLKWLV